MYSKNFILQSNKDSVNWKDEITELNYFFAHLKTKEGETITIPNSLILQKSISVCEKKNEQ